MKRAGIILVASLAMALPGMASAELSEDELADIVHNPSMGLYNRITSYNVCYTKLLRACRSAVPRRGRSKRSSRG